MITVPRTVLRNCQAVFRRLLRKPLGPKEVVSIHAGKEGIHLRLHHAEMPAEYHHAGSHAEDTVQLPPEALAEVEAREGDVTFENTHAGQVQARWHQGGLPRVRNFQSPNIKEKTAFPEVPRLAPMSPLLWKALTEANLCTAHDNVRYALSRIQLRKSGEVVATDGRQLLWVSGFSFPFGQDVLIPRSSVFGCREVPVVEPVLMGLADQFVTFRMGRWTFHWKIDTEGRFPPSEKVIPDSSRAVTQFELDVCDAEFLLRSLPHLPNKKEDEAALTLDLNGQVIVRAKGDGNERVTEVVLSRSQAKGKPMRLAVPRQVWERALKLGFRHWHVITTETPVLALEASRKFVFMPLGKELIVQPAADAVRVQSGAEGRAVRRMARPSLPRATSPVCNHSGRVPIPQPARKPSAEAEPVTVPMANPPVRNWFGRSRQLVQSLWRRLGG